MDFSDYLKHDAVGLAERVARREVTPDELLALALRQNERAQPKTNAICRMMETEARAQLAKPSTGAFAGVPFLIKDVVQDYAGLPTSAGSRALLDNIAPEHAHSVRRYLAAGLVIFGKTNMPELGLKAVSDSQAFGRVCNPWNVAHTPGGSSGGAAAAVASGVVPMAAGSDGGGSIRIPAACCGLFGLKPSRGRVSYAPKDEGWGGFSCGHVVSHSVRDSALLLDIAGQPMPGDPYWTDPPTEPFLAAAGREPARLRIAFTTAAFSSPGLDPECAEAVRAAAKLCESLGHHVEEADPPIDRAALASAGVVIAASVAADLDTVALKRGRPIAEDEVEPITWTSYQRGRTIGGSAYIQALRVAHGLGRTVADFFRGYDILITSTLGSPAVPVGYLHGEPLDLAGYAQRLFAFMPNTQAFNVTGQPAASIPLAMSRSGLPIGVQFVARQGEDALLFSLAGQLERAAPWAGRRAPI